MSNAGMKPSQADRLRNTPSMGSLLKISLGLVLLAAVSTALVYAETIPVDVDGTQYDIEYTATGMTVTGVDADLGFASLIFTVDVTASTGTFEVTFERSFFDAVIEGADDEFFVIADGDEPDFAETQTTAQSRTLRIDLPAGTEDIEIIGTMFGSLSEEPVEEPPEEPPEEPVEEPPEEPVAEPPEERVDEPVEEPVEDPVVEPPSEEKPMTQCGPGTVLVDGACVLDERCGPGTVMVDGVCVLDRAEQPSSGGAGSKGMNRELITGVVAAFVVAGAVGIILALISKASKNKN